MSSHTAGCRGWQDGCSMATFINCVSPSRYGVVSRQCGGQQSFPTIFGTWGDLSWQLEPWRCPRGQVWGCEGGHCRTLSPLVWGQRWGQGVTIYQVGDALATQDHRTAKYAKLAEHCYTPTRTKGTFVEVVDLRFDRICFTEAIGSVEAE